MIAVPLKMLAVLSDQLKYCPLGEIYAKLANEFMEDSLPAFSKWFLPFAPVGWWGYLTPVFLGIASGLRFFPALAVWKAIGLLVSSVLVCGAQFAAFVPFVKINSVMGYPSETYSTSLEIACNGGLVLISAAWLVLSIRGFVMRQRDPFRVE